MTPLKAALFFILFGFTTISCDHVSGKGNVSDKPSSATQDKNGYPASFPIEDRKRFEEIIKNVMSKTDYLTPSIHSEFWRLMRKMGIETKEQESQYKKIMTAGLVYRKQMWKDAMASLEEGKPYKSSERKQYEKGLAQISGNSQLEQNDRMIDDIAAHKPISLQGNQVVATKEIIEKALADVGPTIDRVEVLFTP